MNKLQLYITISLNGFRNQAEINACDEVKQQVTDVSVALEDIDYNPREKNIFYLLRSTDQGVFITVLRTIPTNPTDHLASWIFIPFGIEISDQKINDVVSEVISVVSKSKITADEFNHLREIFEVEYETSANPGATVENKGKTYAHRFFGGDSGYELADYIGSKRYQTSYLKYAGVLLVDKTRAESVTGPDLTNEPLDQMVKIYPPIPDDRPYRPLIFDRPFTQPFLVPLMGTIEVVWESSSAADIRQSIMISRPDMRPDNISLASTRPSASRMQTAAPTTTPEPDTVEKEKAEEEAKTDKTDKNDKTDKTEQLYDKSEDTVEEEKPHQKHEHKYERVEHRKIGYDRIHVYNFEIPAKSAAISGMIRFEIQTRANLESSPIDGYELTSPMQEGASRSNHLIYSPSESMQKKSLWCIGGFIAGVLLTLLCTFTFGHSSSTSATDNDSIPADSTTIYTTPSETPEASVTTQSVPVPANVSLEAAIKYLDTNNLWEKGQLENYPDLRGLYDDMNNFKRERLVDYWGTKLKDSRSFAKIVDHTKKSLKLNKKPLTKGPDGRYNPDKDQRISVRSYLNHLDP